MSNADQQKTMSGIVWQKLLLNLKSFKNEEFKKTFEKRIERC